MLSLDVGRRRIGLAGCDPLGITVTPLPPLHRGRFQKDLEVLEAVARPDWCGVWWLGFPLMPLELRRLRPFTVAVMDFGSLQR